MANEGSFDKAKDSIRNFVTLCVAQGLRFPQVKQLLINSGLDLSLLDEVLGEFLPGGLPKTAVKIDKKELETNLFELESSLNKTGFVKKPKSQLELYGALEAVFDVTGPPVELETRHGEVPDDRTIVDPVAPKPIVSKPVASKPVTPKPVASKPATSKPVAPKPVFSPAPISRTPWPRDSVTTSVPTPKMLDKNRVLFLILFAALVTLFLIKNPLNKRDVGDPRGAPTENQE